VKKSPAGRLAPEIEYRTIALDSSEDAKKFERELLRAGNYRFKH
jgi:hypothetical protein